MTLDEALDSYWAAAYAEGQRGAIHDTPDGLAQTALMAVRSCVSMLVAAERERCAAHVAKCAIPGHSSPLGAFQAAHDRITSGVAA